jgi:hypothetical protein
MKIFSLHQIVPSFAVKPLALAVIALGLSTYCASASLTIDMRAFEVNGTAISGVTVDGNDNSTAFGDGTHTVTGLNIGDVVYFEVFAQVTNSTTFTSGQKAGFQAAFGSITQSNGGGVFGTWTAFGNPSISTDSSPGGVQYQYGQDGNGNPTNGNGRPGDGQAANGVGSSNMSNYGANGSQTGTIQDLNGDGRQDIGSTNQASTNNWIYARASGMIYNNSSTTNIKFRSSNNLTEEFLIGSVQLTIAGLGNGSSTVVAWNNVNTATFTSVPALWFENSAAQSVANGGTLLANAGVTLSAIAVPEPATWAMMLAGFGMLVAFRRSRRFCN